MMSICMASFGQKKGDTTWIDGTQELTHSISWVDIHNLKLEAQTLRSLNDSLVAKINKMLIFHFYACQIIQTINSDGSIRSCKDLIEAVSQYHNYYKNKHE